ncbi:hypothetical protein IQ266_16470 [filamentous cyanobacterium LEGE 11480]|uniref:Uncharacterized protein n=1 Tax=Romeriopsis navalis LEGE 11480 TaxID=2777977 RepID=A0A928VQZ3_9CYAN|nr:secretin N-terminal domain-containing protein [Romeriopsis navalis]MBE9031331.1 hypothetical protein [Romeriopsis navalis LEGE 11480]
MNKQLFGASALLAASVLVTAAQPILAKDTATTAKLTANNAAAKTFKFSNGGTAIFGGKKAAQSKKIAQATRVNPLVPNPTLQTAPPTRSSVPVPPLLPRAAAPPVGDLSVSQIDTSPTAIDLGTAERIPRLVLRDAPVREVLSLLARAAGLNLAFAEQPGATGGAAGSASNSGGPTISLDIENESVQDVFNYVLRIACVPVTGGTAGSSGACASLEANRVGRTIFVGPRLPDDARNTISRTIRLNQASVTDAAAFLTTQGAETQRPFERVQVQTVGEGAAARTIETREPTILSLRANEGVGPLMLRGVSVATNERLNQITLAGTPKKIQMATALLTQLDARKRQVAINVKIVDVNLLGIDEFSPSFSFGVGDSFFSVDGGAALFNFGGTRPPTNLELQGSVTTPPVTSGLFPEGAEQRTFVRENGNAPFGTTGTGARPAFGTTDNPFAPGATSITPPTFDGTTGIITSPGTTTFELPSLFQFPTRFLARLQAQVTSGNAKILTDPTVVIQEGERSEVRLTQDVITNQTVQTTFNQGTAIQNVTFEREQAGLQLDLVLDRIDDNGFVTLSVDPSVTAPVQNITLNSGGGNSNQVTLLSRRSIKSGRIRIRDGQTLVLAGIIQEQDRSEVRKLPILGDIPILGSLFRRTTRNKSRNEVIVMLTPRIMNDTDRSTYGYGYTPSADVQRLLRQQR